jgi:hypothetical protein
LPVAYDDDVVVAVGVADVAVEGGVAVADCAVRGDFGAGRRLRDRRVCTIYATVVLVVPAGLWLIFQCYHPVGDFDMCFAGVDYCCRC